jgi:hypothetical protein
MALNQAGLAVESTPTHDEAIGALPEPLRERLAGEGVFTLRDWSALGRRRHQLFGVTPATVKKLDALARAARA